MKSLSIIALTSLTLSTGAAAQAQSMTGSTFTLGYWANQDQVDTLGHAEGTVAFEVYSGFGTEIGIAIDQYDDISENVTSGELHLTYALNAAATLGLYYGQEDYYGEIYNYGGAEAAYSSGPLYVEGHYGTYTSVTYDAMHYSLDIEYDFASAYGLSALAGLRGATDGDDITYNFLGLGYEFGDSGIQIDATYAFSQIGGVENNIAGIALTYSFGDGVPFKQRVFSSMLPTY